jgi:protein-disulfide isomerase
MSEYGLSVRKEEYLKGDLSSKNILIEYGDYECPYSRLGYRYVQKILKEDKNLQFIFRHFPIRKKHSNAEISAEAALSAGAQHKFWEMHDRLFDNSQRLNRGKLDELSEELQLDLRQFHVDMEAHSYLSWIQKDFRSGVKNGVDDTPTFFMNEKKYQGKLDYKQIKEFITVNKV